MLYSISACSLVNRLLCDQGTSNMGQQKLVSAEKAITSFVSRGWLADWRANHQCEALARCLQPKFLAR
jgi:hypothetical protein